MDRYFAVDCICMFFGSMRFGGTNAVFITQQLPVQIAFFKTIPVDDRNMPDSDPQEVFQKIAAESAYILSSLSVPSELFPQSGTGSAASDRRENGQNVAILHRILWFAVETIDEEDGNLLFRYLKFLQNIRSTAVFVSFEKEDFTSSFPKGCKQSDFDHFPTHSSRPSFFRVSSVGNASTHPLAS